MIEIFICQKSHVFIHRELTIDYFCTKSRGNESPDLGEEF